MRNDLVWLLRRPSVDGTYASALTAAINNAYAAAERSADRIAVCSAERRADRNANISPNGVPIGHADNDTIRSADACAHCPTIVSAIGRSFARADDYAHVNAFAVSYGDADASSNCDADGRAIVGAIANAHVRAVGLADGAADAHSYGSADSDADELSDVCAKPSADFAVLHLGTKSEHHFLRGRLWRHMSDAPRRVRCDGWSRICQRRMRHGELRMLLFLSEPSANDSDLRGGGVGLRSGCMRKRRGAVLLVQRIVHGRGRREL